MISRSAEYSLRAVVCLAANGNAPLTTQQIATATHIPAGYLAKLLQGLVKAGIITSQRGVNGGFVLAQGAGQLTLLDVVQVSDGSHRVDRCPLGLASHAHTLCPLHQRIDNAAASAERELRSVTVEDLCRAGADHLRIPMCTPLAG
jgi:Rrf2 family transcriptional regulator, nitric oxide-sensitive transcriptional repressor